LLFNFFSAQEYAETAVQFGLMTVFVSALPISPFVAMVYNYVEIKVDAWKLLKVRKCLLILI
jgi:anoctamin-7